MATILADPGPAPPDLARHRAVRGFTERLCEPLVTDDYVVQSKSDVSPTKWQLAHTNWFFETFLLMPHRRGDRPLDPAYAFLFNSYCRNFFPPEATWQFTDLRLARDV